MSFPPFKPGVCREPRCTRGAGQSGLCSDHLRATLRRHGLSQLIALLEVMLETQPQLAEPAEPGPPSAAPLLN